MGNKQVPSDDDGLRLRNATHDPDCSLQQHQLLPRPAAPRHLATPGPTLPHGPLAFRWRHPLANDLTTSLVPRIGYPTLLAVHMPTLRPLLRDNPLLR